MVYLSLESRGKWKNYNGADAVLKHLMPFEYTILEPGYHSISTRRSSVVLGFVVQLVSDVSVRRE